MGHHLDLSVKTAQGLITTNKPDAFSLSLEEGKSLRFKLQPHNLSDHMLLLCFRLNPVELVKKINNQKILKPAGYMASKMHEKQRKTVSSHGRHLPGWQKRQESVRV